MKKLLFAITTFGLLHSGLFGQESELKRDRHVILKTNSVPFGRIAGDTSIINEGTFTDTSKSYSIREERGNFYLLSDGTRDGWVFKSTVSLSEISKLVSEQQVTVQPGEFMGRLRNIGMHREMGWRKSTVMEGEWIAQYRAYNGKYGTKMNAETVNELNAAEKVNECNCQIIGKSSFEIKKISIDAEICNSVYAKDTLALTEEVLQQVSPPCPKEIIQALIDRRELTSGKWQVELSRHNAGYDLTVTFTD